MWYSWNQILIVCVCVCPENLKKKKHTQPATIKEVGWMAQFVLLSWLERLGSGSCFHFTNARYPQCVSGFSANGQESERHWWDRDRRITTKGAKTKREGAEKAQRVCRTDERTKVHCGWNSFVPQCCWILQGTIFRFFLIPYLYKYLVRYVKHFKKKTNLT